MPESDNSDDVSTLRPNEVTLQATKYYAMEVLDAFYKSKDPSNLDKDNLARKAISYSFHWLDEVLTWAHAHMLGKVIFSEYSRFRQYVERELDEKLHPSHWANEALGMLLIKGQNPSFAPSLQEIEEKLSQLLSESKHADLIEHQELIDLAIARCESELHENGEEHLLVIRHYWQEFRKAVSNRIYLKDFGETGYVIPARIMHLSIRDFLHTHSTTNNYWRRSLREGLFGLAFGETPKIFEHSFQGRREDGKISKDFERFEYLLHAKYISGIKKIPITDAMNEVAYVIGKELKTLRNWQTKLNKILEYRNALKAAFFAGKLSRKYGQSWEFSASDEERHASTEDGKFLYDIAVSVQSHILSNPLPAPII